MSADRGAASFGSTLRDARERRGVSLRQIANATKISVAALEALERNDISRLPGGIFSRAFVRSYASEIGLDPEAAIQQFIAQFPNDMGVTAGHTSDSFEDHEAVESDRQTAGTFLWLAVISVPVAAALLYFATSGRGAARTAAKPSEGSAAPAPRQEPPPVAAPAQSSAVEAPPPVTPAIATDVRPVPQPALPAVREATAEPADKLTIELAVRRPCWVSATVDGQKTIDRLLQPGERQTIDVRREMVVTAGDASALALTFNGAEARPLGNAGEVVTARFNLTNFKNYLQAR